jgi:hypothetical protein
MSDDGIVTLDELEAVGLTTADVREGCPWAVEYIALDGPPFWLREDLAPLPRDVDGRAQP